MQRIRNSGIAQGLNSTATSSYTKADDCNAAARKEEKPGPDSLGVLPYEGHQAGSACRSLHPRPDGSNNDRCTGTAGNGVLACCPPAVAYLCNTGTVQYST